MERRQDPRLEVRLRCHIAGLYGKKRQFIGLTRNVSRGGMLVDWEAGGGLSFPKPGDLVELEIELPANHVFGRKCLYCQATALRVASGSDGCARVAFQVHQMKFRDSAARKMAAVSTQEEFSELLM